MFYSTHLGKNLQWISLCCYPAMPGTLLLPVLNLQVCCAFFPSGAVFFLPQEEEEDELRKVRGSRCRQRGAALPVGTSSSVGHCPLFALLLVFLGAVLGRCFEACAGWNRGQQDHSWCLWSWVCPCRALPCSPGTEQEKGWAGEGQGCAVPWEGRIIPLRLCWGWYVAALTKDSEAAKLCLKWLC